MLVRQRPFTTTPQPPTVPRFNLLRTLHLSSSSPAPSNLLPITHPQIPSFITRARKNKQSKPYSDFHRVETEFVEDDADDGEELSSANGFSGRVNGDKESEELPYSSGFKGREGERDFDRDPEFAEIIGSSFDDPQKAQARVEERIRRKRSKILHMKTGSPTPMKVIFNKFDFSNSYIWFEFYNTPLPNDLSLIGDAIRSWYIIGRLGGCNSMNMQLSQAPLDNKRPSYDAIQGANVTPTTFYNMGDLEVQDNLARIWVDIGTSEPLLLDVLINALACISSDYVGIKQLVLGGKEFEDWKEDFTAEDPGCSIHKI